MKDGLSINVLAWRGLCWNLKPTFNATLLQCGNEVIPMDATDRSYHRIHQYTDSSQFWKKNADRTFIKRRAVWKPLKMWKWNKLNSIVLGNLEVWSELRCCKAPWLEIVASPPVSWRLPAASNLMPPAASKLVPLAASKLVVLAAIEFVASRPINRWPPWPVSWWPPWPVSWCPSRPIRR